MIDKFGNAFYLIIYLAHFIIVGSYAYQLVFDTKKFLKGRGVDKTATLITRFAGSFMIATVLMAIYIAIKTVAIMNEPANLVIKVAVLSTPLPFRNFLVSKTNW